MSALIEKRFNGDHEIRTENGDSKQIKGYAAVFNSIAKITERFHEKIANGAFSESIGKNDIRALWSHNPDAIIGRNRNGSLQLREDNHGLAFDLTLPNTTLGNDVHENVRSGLVTGVSFGFRVKKDSWERGTDGAPHVRTLEIVDLVEISPTAFPAYEQTYVSARSSEDVLKEIESEWMFSDKEKLLRESISVLRSRLDRITLLMRLD